MSGLTAFIFYINFPGLKPPTSDYFCWENQREREREREDIIPSGCVELSLEHKHVPKEKRHPYDMWIYVVPVVEYLHVILYDCVHAQI